MWSLSTPGSPKYVLPHSVHLRYLCIYKCPHRPVYLHHLCISVHLPSLSRQPSWMVLVVINWFSPHTGLQEELRNWLNMLGPAKFSTRCSASSSHLWCIWMAINCHPVENLQYSDWDGIFISGNCWVVWFKLSGYLEVDKCESPYMVYQLDEHRIFKIFCCFRILQLC